MFLPVCLYVPGSENSPNQEVKHEVSCPNNTSGNLVVLSISANESFTSLSLIEVEIYEEGKCFTAY